MSGTKVIPDQPAQPKCPQCGTPLPSGALAGFCPACLLKMGAAADTGTEGKQPAFTPPSVAELAPLFPQLEILALIGKGGMGAVYKARQKQLDRFVALKILPPGIGNDAAFAERFAREAKALAKLNHPGIVTLYEFGTASGYQPATLNSQLFYFLMEFVDGVNLRQLLHAGRVSAREALAIVPQICDALQFAHDQGIVHRDIKPENILMDRRGRVKVADFGLAKIVGDVGQAFQPAGSESGNVGNTGLESPVNRQTGKSALRDLTDAGKVMGTPQYMSPEQRDNPSEVDHRADIYALGVVFYQMLTGELPGKKIEAPSKKVQIDVRLDEVVLRALEQKPELRYQQASALKTQVETIATTVPTAKVSPANLPWKYRGVDYRSQATLFGLPLVHVATGHDPTTGKKRIARGFIAIGDIAQGVFAFGGLAMGGLAFGGGAVGVVAFGGGALGLVSFGGLAIALLFALGGGAIAPIAIGGGALGYFTFGGGTVGVHALDAMTKDSAAERFFLPWAKTLLANIQWINAAFLALVLPTVIGVPLWLQRHNFNHPPGKNQREETQPPAENNRRRPWSLVLVAALFLWVGIAATWDMGRGIHEQIYYLNFGALGLPIGIGLLRLRPRWRITALIGVWLPFLVAACVGLLVFGKFSLMPNAMLTLFGRHLTGAAQLVGVIVLCTFLSLLLVWMSRVLTRADVKALFRPHHPGRIWVEWAAFAAVFLFSFAVTFDSKSPGANPAVTSDKSALNPVEGRVIPAGPFIAHYPGGTIELVALAKFPETNEPCWLPDGSPATEPFPEPGGSFWTADKDLRLLAIRVKGQDRATAPALIKLDGATKITSIGSATHYPQGYAETVQRLAIPPGMESMNCSIGVADGAWEIVLTLTPGTNAYLADEAIQKTASSAINNWEARVNCIVTKQGSMTVSFRHSIVDNWQARLMAVRADGSSLPLEIGVQENRDGMTSGLTPFNAQETAQIISFQLQRRAYQWVEFRNISLQPGHKTTVVVKDFSGDNWIDYLRLNQPVATGGSGVSRYGNDEFGYDTLFDDKACAITVRYPKDRKAEYRVQIEEQGGRRQNLEAGVKSTQKQGRQEMVEEKKMMDRVEFDRVAAFVLQKIGDPPVGRLGFTPVIERTVEMLAPPRWNWFDLEIGQNVAPGRDASDMDDATLAAWMKNLGADFRVVEKDNRRGLDAEGTGCLLMLANQSHWDSLPADQLPVLTTASSNLITDPWLVAKSKLPATLYFKTRAGGAGLLQIFGFTEAPSGVKIRYKLVQNRLLDAATGPVSVNAGSTTNIATVADPLLAARVNDMKKIRETLFAARLYADTNHGEWPVKLSDLSQRLEPSFIEDISASLDYHRPKPSLNATASANTAALFEKKSAHTGGALVGFADGHVEFVKDTDRLRELRAAVQTAKE